MSSWPIQERDESQSRAVVADGSILSELYICTKIARMNDERQKESFEESAKNAFAGYAMVVLGIVCFVLSLVAISAVVRLIVGASTGTGV